MLELLATRALATRTAGMLCEEKRNILKKFQCGECMEISGDRFPTCGLG